MSHHHHHHHHRQRVQQPPPQPIPQDPKKVSFAAAHYPLEVLDMKIHILNACSAYASLLQQVVTSSTAGDLALLVQKPSANAADSSNNNKKSSSAPARIDSYADFFLPSTVTSNQHVPHGQMKRVALFRYLTPTGVKTMSAEAITATLTGAKMPYITDLIRLAAKDDESEETAMFEQLRELPHTELDIARCCMCVMWELAERGCFTKDGDELTPLAKRDLKKALSTAANEGAAAAASGGGGAGAAAAVAVAGGPAAGSKAAAASSTVVGTGSALGAKVQKNLRALLEEECATAWPHTPVDKAVIFTITQDPKQPRHKPLFKAAVEFPLLKKMKVEGEWCGTKRDAENSAADKSLPTVRRMIKK